MREEEPIRIRKTGGEKFALFISVLRDLADIGFNLVSILVLLGAVAGILYGLKAEGVI